VEPVDLEAFDPSSTVSNRASLMINKLQGHLRFLALHFPPKGAASVDLPQGRRHGHAGCGEGLVRLANQLAAQVEATPLEHRLDFV
jgi:hypothetical protein